MMPRILLLAMLLIVAPAELATAEPAPSSPKAECQTLVLPAGAFVERCDGDFLVGLPWGA